MRIYDFANRLRDMIILSSLLSLAWRLLFRLLGRCWLRRFDSLHGFAFALHGEAAVFLHAAHLLLAQARVVPEGRALLSQGLESLVRLPHRVDHGQWSLVRAHSAVEHAELRPS